MMKVLDFVVLVLYYLDTEEPPWLLISAIAVTFLLQSGLRITQILKTIGTGLFSRVARR
jgi:hypothetical protein